MVTRVSTCPTVDCVLRPGWTLGNSRSFALVAVVRGSALASLSLLLASCFLAFA